MLDMCKVSSKLCTHRGHCVTSNKRHKTYVMCSVTAGTCDNGFLHWLGIMSGGDDGGGLLCVCACVCCSSKEVGELCFPSIGFASKERRVRGGGGRLTTSVGRNAT